MPDVTAAWAQPIASLPHISKRDLLKRYRERVLGTLRWREDEGYDSTWKRLRDLYRLRPYDNFADEDRIHVAVAFATINVIEPSVAINHPKITLEANDPEEMPQATIAEATINYWWRHYNVQPEFRRVVKDMLVYGHGWAKVGYRYIEGIRQVDADEYDQQLGEANAQLDAFAMENPEFAGDLPSSLDVHRLIPSEETVTLEDRPFVGRVSPYDMLVDPESTFYFTSQATDASWIAQRVVRDVEEVKRDTRFKSSTRRKLTADGSVVWHVENSRNHVENDEAGRITLWEFYDLRRRTMCVFTEMGEDFLLDPTPMPYTYGAPFVMVRDYNVPDQFYPIGELEALEPLQQELNETRSSMVQARKLDKRKFLARKSVLTASAIDALIADEDNTIVPIDDDTPFDQVIAPVPVNPARPEMYNHSETILNDFDRVSGVSEYMRGDVSEIRRTATEAAMIQDAANSRAADKLDGIQSAVSQIARCLLQLAQQYMTGDQVARIVGKDGSKLWYKFTRSDIQGEFDFNVEAGSMQPMNETFRRQQALQLMNVMTPFIGVAVDPRALAEHVLREGFGIKDAQKFIMPPKNSTPPDEKLVATMNYKDLPEDIKRQLEAEAGFTPSQLPPPAPEGSGAAPGDHSAQADPRQQLEGQLGLQQQPNGGGAMGPGGQA